MGGKAPSKTTQINEVRLSPEQKKVFNLAMPSIEQAASSDPQVYGGSTVAGFTPAEFLGQSSLLDAAGGSLMQQAQAGANANQFLLDPRMLSIESNPYLQGMGEAIAGGMTNNLTRSILPQLRRGSETAMGPYGATSRQGIAEGLAVGETQGAIGDALQKLAFDAYNRGLSGMERGIALNPQTMAGMLVPGQTASAVGQQQRAMEQALLDEQVNKFYLQQNLPFLKAQDLMGLIGSMPGGQGISSVTGAQPQKSPLMGGLGGAASGAALGSMILPGIGTAAGAGLGALLGIFG
jgi:hypothetical protein